MPPEGCLIQYTLIFILVENYYMEIRMPAKKLLEWINPPTSIITFILGVIAILTLLGLEVVSPNQKLQLHAQQSNVIHDSMSLAIKRIEKRQDKYDFLIDALVRGECIKNTKENLARQGLMQKCSQEGIVPKR